MNPQPPDRPNSAWADDLDLFGVSPARAKILRFFLMRPDAAPHVREIQRVLNLGSRSIQRELARLVELGAIERIEDEGLVRHRARPVAPIWDAVRALVRQSPDPVPCVHSALIDVDGIECAFVFGSVAAGTHREESDIDIFLIEGPGLDKRVLFKRLSELSLVLEKGVSPVRYTGKELKRRLVDPRGAGVSFLRASLTGPKRVVRGGGEVLDGAISMAAGPPEPQAPCRDGALGGPQGSTSDEPTLPARVQRLLSDGDLARVEAAPVDVAQIWKKALENAGDAELLNISLEGAIQSAYTAGFNAALCLLLAYGLKTRSGRGHHELTFSVAKELGGAGLEDLVVESSEIRGLRAGSVYNPVLAGEEDRASAIEWMRKTLPLIREALMEADQALAPRLPSYQP